HPAAPPAAGTGGTAAPLVAVAAGRGAGRRRRRLARGPTTPPGWRVRAGVLVAVLGARGPDAVHLAGHRAPLRLGQPQPAGVQPGVPVAAPRRNRVDPQAGAGALVPHPALGAG